LSKIKYSASHLALFTPGTSTNGDEDVHWWEAWDDDAVDRKRKRASSPDINEEDAVWHASLHEMPVEVL
jgi:hypothetical protein